MIDRASRAYIRALRNYRANALENETEYKRACDELLGAFAPGVPDEHLAFAFDSFRQALTNYSYGGDA